ncbi:MAG: ATP synthase F1 subunit delta [Clostridiales bacterium]|nr:ATP synthase F1 subunit delta [Clostridiales bacterium]
MIEGTVARRYAQALFSLAEEKNRVEEYLRDWQTVALAIHNEPKLKELFFSRQVGVSAKKELVSRLFAGKAEKDVLNFVFLLLDKSREGHMEQISEHLRGLADEKNGELLVRVQSAAPLAKKQENALSAALAKATGKKIRLEKTVEPGLIGGFKLVVGDAHIDGSVAGQLSLLQQHLVRGEIF